MATTDPPAEKNDESPAPPGGAPESGSGSGSSGRECKLNTDTGRWEWYDTGSSTFTGEECDPTSGGGGGGGGGT